MTRKKLFLPTLLLLFVSHYPFYVYSEYILSDIDSQIRLIYQFFTSKKNFWKDAINELN